MVPPPRKTLATGVWSIEAAGVPNEPIDPRVDIGRIHLKVPDIDRALPRYVGVLGFEEQTLRRSSLPEATTSICRAA